jgi:hypothetical protein
VCISDAASPEEVAEAEEKEAAEVELLLLAGEVGGRRGSREEASLR